VRPRRFKADLRHPDVSITEQAYVYRYGMNDTVWNRYGYVTTCRLRYYRTVLFVPVPYKYIDQCKDTYCKGEWVPCIPVQAKGKDAKHCRYIWRIVRKRNRVQCRVGVECFPQLAVVPLFREQYRLVDNPPSGLYWIRPMIRSRSRTGVFKLVVNGSADVL
jgi:hypothetical protein